MCKVLQCFSHIHFINVSLIHTFLRFIHLHTFLRFIALSGSHTHSYFITFLMHIFITFLTHIRFLQAFLEKAECRACVCAVWLPSGIRLQNRAPTFFLFPSAFSSFPFSLVYKVYIKHCSPPPPNLLSNFNWAYRIIDFANLEKRASQDSTEYPGCLQCVGGRGMLS